MLQCTLELYGLHFPTRYGYPHPNDKNLTSEVNLFYIRFISSLYRFKYSTCFTVNDSLPELIINESGKESYHTLLEGIRKQTWHRTVVDQNTVPTFEAIKLHSMRCTYTLNRLSNALTRFYTHWDPTEWGWKIMETDLFSTLVPIWDTDSNLKRIATVLKRPIEKCGCKKSICNPSKRICKCVRRGSVCTSLCTCVGCNNRNCSNHPPDDAVDDGDSESDSDQSREPVVGHR